MIVVFDIGKTNKKCFIFNENYRIVFEKTTQLPECTDEDGDACEDLHLLKNWVLDSFQEILEAGRFQIRAVNVTTYGASLVYLDAGGQVLTPLYNYLKPFPNDLQSWFFDMYGEAAALALETASPILGSLNSGLQALRLKHQKPLIFKQVKYILHLPQFVASLLSRQYASEITSIGCHTLLWNFQSKDYSDWVKAEGIMEKFPPMQPSNRAVPISSKTSNIWAGAGLHDSSAALIPYLACFDEPFVLISTGTWCISLNPFNDAPLTAAELEQDCLCYLTYTGNPVKAARFFGGFEHEQAVKELSAQFNVAEDFYRSVNHSNEDELSKKYREMVGRLVEKQTHSTLLVLGKTPVQRIFVDGGFSQNELFMTLLAEAFPGLEIYAATVPHATALGTAMAIHTAWNEQPLPQHLISLKKYSTPAHESNL